MFPVCPTKANMNERHLLYILKENECENFIKYCPEWSERLISLSDRYKKKRNKNLQIGQNSK